MELRQRGNSESWRAEFLGGSGGMPLHKSFRNLCCREAISFILDKHLLFLNHQVYSTKLMLFMSIKRDVRRVNFVINKIILY